MADTLTVPGVVPLAGVTVSQLPPVVVAPVAVKLIAPGAPASAMVCAAGAVPPAGCVKVNPAAVGAGVAVMVPEVTVRVTVIVAGLLAALGEVTVTVPT